MPIRLPFTDPSQPHLKVGDFDLAVVAGGLNAVRWHGVEVLRGVHCLIRDENWATFAPENCGTTMSTDTDPSQGTFRQTFELGSSAAVDLTVRADHAGRLELAVEITAKRDFLSNRTGLVVLHPIRDVAGTKLTVLHPDQSETQTEFPKLISPGQPISNIAALSHRIGDVAVRVTLSGDVFEMEDQRNWSDASFKTYCRPLALPYPFRVLKGEVIRQKLTLQVEAAAGFVAADQSNNSKVTTVQMVSPTKIPEILLAVESDWLPDAGAFEGVRHLMPAGLLVRVYAGDADARPVTSVVQAARRISDLIDLEIVLSAGDPSETLLRMAAELDAAGLSPRRVFALPIDWMRSYQPGEAPPLATLETCIVAAAAAFPNAQIGAGMMTNFTEMNRNRPRSGFGHFVTHGNTAIVHAADDTSVWQTLEALPHIFESAQAIAAGRAYRLGLVSIGMRSNPYGNGLVSNPDRQQIAMTGEDPRQTTTFAAAYAIGAAVAAAIANVEAMALAAPLGRFGVMRSTGPSIAVFPIFHAIRALIQISGKAVTKLQGLDQGLVGIVASDGTLLVANCSTGGAMFQAPQTIDARILNDGDPATSDPEWLNTASTLRGERFALASGSCLFAKMAVQA